MTQLFAFLGGLGLFLFAIKYMSDGLQELAGDKLRQFLEKGTKTPLRGVITGTIVTGLIQSSSGTTVLAIGLVNSGLMTLRQAIGVIMGANIGTTVTAYLIGFKLSAYSLPIIFVGGLILFFCKKEKLVYLGQVILGFGLLFYGMDVMGTGLKPLANSPLFTNLMLSVENNIFLGVGVGTILTAIVQSSSATIGIMQELANQGLMTYMQALPLLFGSNIGTTATALLAGLGAAVNAKRASLVHFLFNVIGTLIFLPLCVFGIFPALVELSADILTPGGWEAMNIKMQIAQTHGVFNILNTLLFLPFVATLDKLVCVLIKEKEEVHTLNQPKYLETRLLGNTALALSSASRELLHMGRLAGESLEHVIDYYLVQSREDKEETLLRESAVDNLEQEITDYVIKITRNHDINKTFSQKSYTILQALGDIERIGDHAENLVELTDYILENKIIISQEANESLHKMMKNVQIAYRDSLTALRDGNRELAMQVIERDDIIDFMEQDLRRGHISRLNEGKCSAGAGAVYLDILSQMERIGDHAVNIAKYTLDLED